MTTYVVIDWRPYDLPEAYGPFDSEADADTFARQSFGIGSDPDEQLPDGITVRELQSSAF